jgi:hypothetical protein
MVSKKATLARQAYQGATLGFGDELYDRAGALYAAALGAGDYKDLLKEAREMTKQELSDDWKEHPVLSIGANIAGGIPLGLTSGARALAARAATGGRLARTAKGFGLGARYGAAAGFGTANPEEDKGFIDSLDDRLVHAGIGGLTGGVVNTTIAPAVGHIGKKIGSYLYNETPNLQKVARKVGESLSNKAEKYYAEILAARPDLPDQLSFRKHRN